MAIHHAAELGYQRAAADYERVRPSYPTRALGVLADALDLGPGKRVAEVGAGTGKFTRLLALTGARVIAVEPVAAMRSRLAELLPQVEVVDGLAEATGLPGGSVDAVVAAQAWHWFDPAAALAEVERITRAGGRLGLVWNTLDETVPWVAEYSSIYRQWRTDAVPGHRDGTWRKFFDTVSSDAASSGAAPSGAALSRTASSRAGSSRAGSSGTASSETASSETGRCWEPLGEEHVPNPYVTDREGVLGQALTSSVISTLDDGRRAQVRRQLEAVLERHEESRGNRIEIPYVTDVYWTSRI